MLMADISKTRMPAIATEESQDGNASTSGPDWPPTAGIIVYPSLHWHMWDTTVHPQRQGGRSEQQDSCPLPPFELGDSQFKRLLPHDLCRRQAVVFQGPRDTFKSTFAVNFLAHGIINDESGLLLCLSDRPMLGANPDCRTSCQPSPRQVSKEMRDMYASTVSTSSQNTVAAASLDGLRERPGHWFWDQLESVGDDVEPWRALALKTKANINVWKKKNVTSQVWLIEANFLSGMVLPEEFVAIVPQSLRRRASMQIQILARKAKAGGYVALCWTMSVLSLSVIRCSMRVRPPGSCSCQ